MPALTLPSWEYVARRGAHRASGTRTARFWELLSPRAGREHGVSGVPVLPRSRRAREACPAGHCRSGSPGACGTGSFGSVPTWPRSRGRCGPVCPPAEVRRGRRSRDGLPRGARTLECPRRQGRSPGPVCWSPVLSVARVDEGRTSAVPHGPRTSPSPWSTPVAAGRRRPCAAARAIKKRRTLQAVSQLFKR